MTVQGTAIDTTQRRFILWGIWYKHAVETLGGLTGGSQPKHRQSVVGSYDINTDGQAFSFSETSLVGDTPVTSQTVTSTIASPTLYSDTLTQVAGDKGTLAGALSATGIPTVTTGGRYNCCRSKNP